MPYTANLLLRTLPAIAHENGLQSQQQGQSPIFDFSDWPDPQDGSGIKAQPAIAGPFLHAATGENILMTVPFPFSGNKSGASSVSSSRRPAAVGAYLWGKS
jgi:hypothetical protein